MRQDDVESWVARYLDRRAAEPALTPQDFATRNAGLGEPFLRAARAALEVERLLPQGADGVPDEIGPYRVRREIGRGGMGVVYEVERDGGQRLALKLLPGAALLGPRPAERFRREAQTLARVAHPSIVARRDAGTWHGSPYIVMDLVEGEPLGGARDAREAARIVRELALAVQAAHEAGILHRDIKPQNVILRADGRPVLLDFGLVAAEGEASLTSTGDLLGTPRYMAPEQALGRASDARTDVHGLGLVLYELACGHPAYARAGEARSDVLRAVAAGRIARPRRVAPALPAELEKILLQALARSPERRFATAGALAADLERFLAGVAVRARPPGALVRAVEAARARPAAALAAAALVALPLVALGVFGAARANRAADERTRLGATLDQALWAWLEGNAAAARRKASEVLRADAREPDARALLAALDGEPGREPGELAGGLAAFERGELAAAETAFRAARAADPSSLVAAVMAARSARAAGRVEEAARELAGLAASFPGSSSVAAELSAAELALGRPEAAERELRRAIALNREGTLLVESLAGLLLERGRLEEGVELAHAAALAAVHQGAGRPTRLSELLERAPDAAAVRAELRRRLAVDPARTDTRFALASSLDTAHEIESAAAEYEAVLEREPEHGYALVYLAWLRLGADREHCASCRSAFDAAPELVDAPVGRELLVRALELDQGRDAELFRSIVTIAGVKGAVAPVRAVLERLHDPSERTARMQRIASALERLRRMGG